MTESDPLGKFYGIGVGPGNPEWLTLQAVRILKSCDVVFAPRARIKQDSLALEIAKEHLATSTEIRELVFPMSKNAAILDDAWNAAATEVEKVLRQGKTCCFLTIGDCMLYSTFIYLRRALEARIPGFSCEAIPGIPAFVAAASLTGIPLGEGRKPLVIVPASGDLDRVEWALESGGTVVVMKVGEKLHAIQSLLQEKSVHHHAMLASKVGLLQQCVIPLSGTERIETETAYLSLAIIPADTNESNSLKEIL